MTTIHLGISTCPNDTFTFHGILEKCIDLRGLEFRVELLDVEQLNTRLFAGDFDVAKASFHAALLLADDLGVLPTGSALGFGNGPLLLAARSDSHPRDSILSDGETRPARVLCPGQWTTATLLYKLFHDGQGNVKHTVFSEIMPALRQGDADFGVCIHEGRFTWKEQGLALVEDLGQVWERETSHPLPLGGILARLRLGQATLKRVQAVLRDSLEYALANRNATVPTMRQFAQELSEEVMFSHVDLYVNQWTKDLGKTGREALATLSARAKSVSLVPDSSQELRVLDVL